MRKIVIVDDKAENLELLGYLLGRTGHEVATALGGRKGLELVRELRPDLVLIDLHMPGIDGWELARRIRRDDALSYIRLLAVSVGPATIAGIREAGFDGFFPMPFEPADLIGTVDALLGRAPVPGPFLDAGSAL